MRLSQLYCNRRNIKKIRGDRPYVDSNRSYEVRFPELVNIAFNQIWNNLD